MANKAITILGFDFGIKHIGVAIGQSITRTAQPLTTLSAENGVPHWGKIKKIISAWQPNALIVGIPVNMDGSQQAISKQASQFAKQLAKRYDLPVHEVDERLTTVAAKERLFEKYGYKGLAKENVDSLAASLIVEDWLQAQLNE